MRHKLCTLIVAIVLLSLTSVCAAGSTSINLNFVDEDVRTIFYTISAVSGMNIVVDDSVQGKVTLQVKNVSVETAIDLITRTKGLTYQKFGNVLAIGTPNNLGRGFGNVHVYKLQYAQPKDVLNVINSMLFGSNEQQSKSTTTQQNDKNKTASPASSNSNDRVQADESTNSIVFYGSQGEADRIKNIINEMDVPTQQVSLEAQVVAISKNALKDLGIDWEWQKTPSYPEYEPPTVQVVQNADGTTSSVVTEPGKFTRDKSQMVGTIQFGRSPGGYPYEFYYQAKISALISNGNAKVLARPKVTTINGKQAYILIGDSIPVPTTTTQNNITTNSFEYKDAGIMLKYTPRINSSGEITAIVHTEVSTPVLISSLNAYQITKREASTEVRMKDGETMVIGGLIGSQESGGKNKVPFLGDLPILGKLFQSVHNTKTETEVVIFLTPHIVK